MLQCFVRLYVELCSAIDDIDDIDDIDVRRAGPWYFESEPGKWRCGGDSCNER
jgi:hypothetical protein